MAKDKGRQDEDKVDVDEIAEGKDEDVAATSAAGSSLATLMKSRLARVLAYSLVAILLVITSVVVSILVVNQQMKPRLDLADRRWEEKKPDPLGVLPIQDFKISTADTDEPHFVRLNLSLGYEAKNMKVVTELNARKVEIIDLVNRIVGGLRKDELDTPEEREQLKERIREAINAVLQHGEVKAVYFTEFSVM